MLRTVVDFVVSEVTDATTQAATSFYQGAKNFATDLSDYSMRKINNRTQQTDAEERKARNEKRRTELSRHRLFFEADRNNARAAELATFRTEIANLSQQTEAELITLKTPYFSRFTNSGAITIKENEKSILFKLSQAKTFASLKLLAQQQTEFVIKNSSLDLLLDRIKQVPSEGICNQRATM